MFTIDKYNVNSLDDVIIHKDIYKKLIIGYDIKNRLYDINKLDKLIESKSYNLLEEYHESKPAIYDNYNELPNLLIHGSPGCGKHTLIKLLLRDIFDDSINNTFIETYYIKGYGNTVVDVEIEQSRYHLIIEPNNTGFDKYLIQEIVKEYAKKKIINKAHNKYPFRIVVINNIDNLNYYAQTSLRCTMEKYHKTCRFILCGNQISKIIDPIKSRCLDVRIPAPTNDELSYIIYKILINENKIPPKNKINSIIEHSNRNIKQLLWILDMSLYGITDFELLWKKSLDKLIEIMICLKEKNVTSILNESLIVITRTILYNIFTTNIPSIDILNEIIQKIIISNKFNTSLIYDILQHASDTEVRLNKGNRCIIHLDAFICKIYKLIYDFYHK
jgi:replication factor C subunit 3/5